MTNLERINQLIKEGYKYKNGDSDCSIIETYRDKWLAHDDKKKPKIPSITGEEIKSLFEVLAKMLNTITGRLNSESWSYSQVEDDVKHHVRLVVDHLRRFEPYRLKEIEKEYQINIKAIK